MPSMNLRTLILTLIALLPGLSALYAQDIQMNDFLAECERKYGKDADLMNGEKYFYPYGKSSGDPFFFSEARGASITIHNKRFEDQLLRYDIYKQKLILDYTSIFGATSSLVLRNEWVEEFAFEKHLFRRMAGPGGKLGFFQVVTDGPITCVYRWSKNFSLNLNSGVQNYYFTDPTKESYLIIDGQFHMYRSNSHFIKAFDQELQKSIKQFMRQAKIKVNKASDSQMRHLVEYCNSLSHED